MDAKSSLQSLELSPELVHQYKDALSRVSDDLRLVVLLVFNAFEEGMKAVAAWRLSCSLDNLPKPLTNSPSLLFDVVLTADKSAQKLRSHARLLSELRNEVAHGFHKRNYKPKLGEFVKAVSGKPCPTSVNARREAFIDAVSSLALDIAVYVDAIGERGDFPVPMLNLELGDIARKA